MQTHEEPIAHPRIPVIAGPTAGGKTALAVAVAKAFDKAGAGLGEVISADAFQVFQGMDIGTGKVTAEEMQGVPHHLIDILEPDDSEPFTVARWLELAQQAVAEIRTRARVPIVAGGTHLYIKAFMEGMFEGPGADETIRQKYRKMEPVARRRLLERVDPQAAQRIHPNDERRTIRALEVFEITGTPISTHQAQWGCTRRADARLIVLDWPTEAINSRINARVKAMAAKGLVEEVESLLMQGKLGEQAIQALGYKQLGSVLREAFGCDGSEDEAVRGVRLPRLSEKALARALEQTKIETRRFAKNQRTWLKRLSRAPDTVVLFPLESNLEEMTQVVVRACFGEEV